MNNLPIGVFDSGLGGLTVAKAILNLLPQESIYYFGDLAHLPYGNKSAKSVKKIALQCVDFLLNQKIKLLVVACNTATSIALEEIVKKVDIPVIGVINPGAKAGVKASLNYKVGVIGTTRTVQSNAYLQAILNLHSQFIVFQKATPLLVPFIEEGWIEHPSFDLVLKEYLSFFDLKEIDTLVLGCTHYPLIKEKIKALKPSLNIVDSAHATALSVQEALQSLKLFQNQNKQVLRIFASDISETFTKLSEKIMGQPLNIELISL